MFSEAWRSGGRFQTKIPETAWRDRRDWEEGDLGGGAAPTRVNANLPHPLGNNCGEKDHIFFIFSTQSGSF